MYDELWKITNLSTGEATICETCQIKLILVEYTEPWECVDEHVRNEIYAACESIYEQCLSGFKGPDFEADCSYLNVKFDRVPDYMTEEELLEFLFE